MTDYTPTGIARTAVLALAIALTGCPTVPPYPYYGPGNTWTRQQVVDEGNRISACLEAYIDHWFDRGQPANEPIPEIWPASGWDARTWNNAQCNGRELVPQGHDPGIVNFRMVREQDIDTTTPDGPWKIGQWGVRPEQPHGICLRRCETDADCTGGATCELACPSLSSQSGCPRRCSTASAPPSCLADTECPSGNTCFKKALFPDPHVTYMLLPNMFLPYGAKVIIEGEFPHSRYFSIQPSAANHIESYRHEGFGSGEVAFVDADIDPLPGHTNPFRVGADRHATSRGYRIECTSAIGNPVDLDPSAWSIPYFRQAGNHRHCGGIVYRGPWGDPVWKASGATTYGDGLGLWDIGDIWLRIYAPDHAYGPMAGIEPPKVTFQLADGRRFFIDADITGFAERLNIDAPLKTAQPGQNPPAYDGAGKGWLKQFGVFRAVGTGFALSTWPDKAYLRNMDKGITGRGHDIATNLPGYLEPHATGSVHINYLNRGMCLGNGRVYSVAGKLPTFPRTRNGESPMTKAEMRYWSITSYTKSPANELTDPNFVGGKWISTLMDEELVLNANNEYVIVWSRPQDRPANATAANGVTWQDWGPEACRDHTIRWMSIGPEWAFSKTCHQGNCNWETDWASPTFQESKIGLNNRNGFLGVYQPTRGYRTKAQFEAITTPITPAKIPLY